MQLAAPIVLGISAATSTSLNAIVLYVFAKVGVKKLAFKDAFIVSMTVGDLIQSLFGYSLEIYSMGEREGGEKKSEIGINFCKAAGFLVTFLALSSTAHLTALAFDRYLTICKPFKATRLHGSFISCFLLIASCWFYAFAWAAFPLLGWSSYDLESDQLRCSICWASQVLKDQMYIIFLFVFCFLVPVTIMVISFVSVKKELRQMQLRAANLFGRESKASKDNIRAEKKHTKLAIVMCVVFISMWFPYSFLSFWASFFTHIAQTPVVLGTVCAFIAKSSTIFNPVIYTIMHKRFRQSLIHTPFKVLFCCPSRISPMETSAAEKSNTGAYPLPATNN